MGRPDPIVEAVRRLQHLPNCTPQLRLAAERWLSTLEAFNRDFATAKAKQGPAVPEDEFWGEIAGCDHVRALAEHFLQGASLEAALISAFDEMSARREEDAARRRKKAGNPVAPETEAGTLGFDQLIGMQISSIEFVRGYLQIRSDDACLNLYEMPRVETKDGASLLPGNTGYGDVLVAIVNRKVTGTSVTRQSLRVTIDNGTTLSLEMSAIQTAEGAFLTIKGANRMWVWGHE